MKKLFLFLLSIIAIACSSEKDQTIRLSVDQTVQIPIKSVTISTGIVERGEEPTAVEKNGYGKLAEVVKLLEDLGYDKKQLEINSGEVSYQPYNDEEPYSFSSSIKFDLNDTDKIDTFRRSLTNAGATRFNITSFKNSKEDSMYDAAYRQAINTAKKKANRLLSNQTVVVGKILNLHENVKETIEMDATNQLVEPPALKIRGNANLERVDPLYHKEYYTKKIEFNIEFALDDK